MDKDTDPVKEENIESARFQVKKDEGNKDIFFSHLNNFANTIDILTKLNETLPKKVESYVEEEGEIISNKIEDMNEEERRKLTQFIEDMENMEEEEKEKIETESEKVSLVLSRCFRNFIYENRFKMFIKEMSLVYLVARFESFLRSSIELAFHECPAILKSKQNKITYEQLFDDEFESIDELRDYFGSRKARSILHKDIKKINRYLSETFNLDLSEFDEWEEFRERFYRRNICVHNNCYPNDIYRKKTGYDGERTRLEITFDYLEDSYDIFLEFSQKIYQHMSEKFGPITPDDL